ncbi:MULTISPECIES: pyridoxal phosphate-dependent aminotransferase [Haloferax]|uniref:Aminotransferase n=2 Tax=Haloferax gibbonsii TaxID=35746 RepID=A0A0K1ITW4_HALGI|nr:MULTISPECIES: pyridoxal phosphate-dependent aminotransferase [Haloferax]AKU07750.1 aminotransferase class I/II [Haloferax gibbonsii]ELZ77647.1 class I/II aminotransferase [Haloferax gibbonsii ATCC 33959]QOS11868.1 pyridoxal phosphate-dependent aminotransferase (homolog to histidinol-phosphate aminotransferase / aspartate aminotransferase) [Haloferax gibbonsii]RDZ55623.1 pyridoxal phosphate-dependent aminotransferase [Haloferax sp. Atlit-4N]REA04727.1 pyridoxal phosphate-dependent aminotrans
MTTTFPEIPYLEWIVDRADEAAHDLATSDLGSSRRGDDLVPPVLSGRSDPEDATLAGQLAARYGVSESSVLVTAGATNANFLAACALLDLATDDDEDRDEDASRPQVLVEKPGYQPLVATSEALGARVDRFVRPPEYDYELEPHRLDGASTDAFAYAIVTNRHNPSGKLTPRAELAEVASAAADAGGYLLVDEVYAPFVDPAADGPFGGITASGLENTVVTGSLTKFYGLGGLRVGWIIGPEEVVSRARSASMYLPAVAEPSTKLARRALHHGDEIEAAAREHLSANHDLLATFVAERDELDGRIHAGGTFAFLDHASVDGDAVADAAWDRGVLVVPGRFFDAPESFRISLGGDPEAMEAGLAAFGDALDDLAE